MVGIIPSKSLSTADAVARPKLQLVANYPSHRANNAVMACLTARRSGNSELLRKASAAALENEGELYAVLVDLPRIRFGNGRIRTLIDDAILASYLGAKISWLESSDPVGELLRLARQSRVGRIFVTRDRPVPFSRPFGRTAYSELLKRGEGFRIDVFGFQYGN